MNDSTVVQSGASLGYTLGFDMLELVVGDREDYRMMNTLQRGLL